MSRFYGVVKGNRGAATRCGHSTMSATAASWKGAIRTELFMLNGEEHFEVREIPWHGTGVSRVIASGKIGGEA